MKSSIMLAHSSVFNWSIYSFPYGNQFGCTYNLLSYKEMAGQNGMNDELLNFSSIVFEVSM
jgi:hypothetical protein